LRDPVRKKGKEGRKEGREGGREEGRNFKHFLPKPTDYLQKNHNEMTIFSVLRGVQRPNGVEACGPW
jgi:hypothetical protein